MNQDGDIPYVGAIVNVPSGLVGPQGPIDFAGIVVLVLDPNPVNGVVKLMILSPDGINFPGKPFQYSPIGNMPGTWHWPKSSGLVRAVQQEKQLLVG